MQQLQSKVLCSLLVLFCAAHCGGTDDMRVASLTGKLQVASDGVLHEIDLATLMDSSLSGYNGFCPFDQNYITKSCYFDGYIWKNGDTGTSPDGQYDLTMSDKFYIYIKGTQTVVYSVAGPGGYRLSANNLLINRSFSAVSASSEAIRPGVTNLSTPLLSQRLDPTDVNPFPPSPLDTFSDRFRFSPSGDRYLFIKDRQGQGYHVQEVNFISGNIRQLSDSSSEEYSPIYSPDGKSIAFLSKSYSAILDKQRKYKIFFASTSSATPSYVDLDGKNVSYISVDYKPDAIVGWR